MDATSQAIYNANAAEHKDMCVDCEGCSLEVGDLVVFNQSGTLVRGNIRKISRARNYVARNNPQWQHVQWIVQIDNSIVRNTLGIYRLRQYDRGGEGARN